MMSVPTDSLRIQFFRDMTLCNWIVTDILSQNIEERFLDTLTPEDKDITLPLNAGVCLPSDTIHHTTRIKLSAT
jgi:hypothetical protein